jgi:hypothetical protein
VCVIDVPGQEDTAEVCNALDDDCDGLTDEDTDLDALVDMGSYQIYKYEASHPDADGESAGNKTTRSCSKAGVIPWY